MRLDRRALLNRNDENELTSLFAPGVSLKNNERNGQGAKEKGQ